MKHHQGNSTEGCVEVISAIGTIGTADDETGNGATNEAAAKAAKKANAKRFVLVSASKDSYSSMLPMSCMSPLKDKAFRTVSLVIVRS